MKKHYLFRYTKNGLPFRPLGPTGVVIWFIYLGATYLLLSPLWFDPLSFTTFFSVASRFVLATILFCLIVYLTSRDPASDWGDTTSRQ